MASIAQRLVTLCATLGEFPHIRFAADGGGRTEGVARGFQVRYEVVLFCLLTHNGYYCSTDLLLPRGNMMIPLPANVRAD